MKQLSFGFIKKPEFIIQFPNNIKAKLIKQMAIVIIQLNKKKGENNNGRIETK